MSAPRGSTHGVSAPGGLLWGVSAPGVCSGGVCSRGCLLWGGICSQGVSAPGGSAVGGVCSQGGCIPACTEADMPPNQEAELSIRPMSGQYTSYWNAFLLNGFCPLGNIYYPLAKL